MNLRHAAALALVGWYLILPPSDADLDSSCTGAPTIMDYIRSYVRDQSATRAQFERCLPESESIATDAPISKWNQKDSCQTLKG